MAALINSSSDFYQKKKQKQSCPVALKPVVQYDRILPCNPILSHCLFFSFPVFDVHRSNDNWGLESFLFLSGNSLCMHYSADLLHWQQNLAEGDLFIRNNKTPAKPSHCGAADGTECFMAAAIKHPADTETIWRRGAEAAGMRGDGTGTFISEGNSTQLRG